MPTNRNLTINANGVCSGCRESYYVRTDRDGQQHCTYCSVECANCHTWYPGSEGYCQNCMERCTQCRHYDLRENRFRDHNGIRMCIRCADAHQTCGGCGTTRNTRTEQMVFTNDTNDWRCYENCASYCDDCGTYHANRCTVVRLGAPRNCGGYHHTRPSMWLGGPLPRDHRGRQEGYYLGFELEITAARRDDCETLTGWSEKRLGTNIFDCKTDSTVSGFEIATQPMTPEFFERVPWDDFFEMLNTEFHRPDTDGWDEPDSHGLHVHIGKVAFRTDANIAAYSYLLNQGNHLERIGRRQPTTYSRKVTKPVSEAIRKKGGYGKQVQKITQAGVGLTRGSVNLNNEATIEVRSFKSTRTADHLRSAVRVVYLGADYIRYLAESGQPKVQALQWGEFCKWIAVHRPDAFPGISGTNSEVALQKAALAALNDEAADLLSVPVNYQF
jgi:hypothetical protein